MPRRRRSRQSFPRPSATLEHRILASKISMSPTTPQSKRPRVDIISSPIGPKLRLFDIDQSSPRHSTPCTPKFIKHIEIAESPTTPKSMARPTTRNNFEIDASPQTPKQPIQSHVFEIDQSPFHNSQSNVRDSSHWFQDKVERKKRIRKSLQAVLDAPPICHLAAALNSASLQMSLERASYMNRGSSSHYPYTSTATKSANSPIRPSIIATVTNVKTMNTHQRLINIILESSVGLTSKDLFFRCDQAGIILLDRETTDGMGMECGTRLRLTYPLHWHNLNGQIVIHNIFWIEAIERNVKVSREKNVLFTMRCPCQVKRHQDNTPLCSVSQCNGMLPIEYQAGSPADTN